MFKKVYTPVLFLSLTPILFCLLLAKFQALIMIVIVEHVQGRKLISSFPTFYLGYTVFPISINQSINYSINQSINSPTNQSVDQPINQSINSPTNQSVNQKIPLKNPSINQKVKQTTTSASILIAKNQL